jgi:hypothetical protein
VTRSWHSRSNRDAVHNLMHDPWLADLDLIASVSITNALNLSSIDMANLFVARLGRDTVGPTGMLSTR